MVNVWTAAHWVCYHLVVTLITLLVISEVMNIRPYVDSSRIHSCPRHCHCRNVTVDCSNSHMVQLGQQFPLKTMRLVLDRNRISKVPAKAFQGLSQLTYLSMSENNISLVEVNAFEDLSNLQLLFLDKNNLRTLPEEVFIRTPKLGNLSLTYNSLSLRSLNESVCNMPNVEGIYLKNNALELDTKFPDGFSAMSSLRIIDLSSNRGVRNLTEDYFEALQGVPIDWLSLSDNPIVEVHPDAFMNLPNLKYLDLSDTTMPLTAMEGILQGLRNSTLTTLNMEYMFVYGDLHGHMAPDFFFSLRDTGLEDLDMEGNYGGYLSNLHNGLFKWVRELRHLTLDKCQIISIAKDAFKGLHRLKKLSLRHNFISCMTNCDFISYGPVLHQLMWLDLSDNVITHSNSKGNVWFQASKFPRLHHLYLQNNRISLLEERMFDLKDLRTLDLSGNPIHHIQPETFGNLHSLETLTITGSIYLQVLPNGTFKGLKNLLHLRLNNNQLQSIHPRAFNGLKSLEVLEMNGNRIGGQGNFGDLHLTAELRRLKRLDLGNNRLESVPVDILVHQPRLRVLLLHYNRIVYVDKKSLMAMKELENLDLSYNDIMEVGEDTFSQMPALRKLDLAGNPFLCTCNLKNFLDWLRVTDVRLNSVDQHKCSGPHDVRGLKLLAYYPTAWECRIKAVLVPILSALGIAVLVLALGCVMYRCICRRNDHIGSDDNKDRKGRNWGWIRELLPVNGDMTPSGSEEGNVEDPLIEREHELCQETTCQESQTEENHIL